MPEEAPESRRASRCGIVARSSLVAAAGFFTKAAQPPACAGRSHGPL